MLGTSSSSRTNVTSPTGRVSVTSPTGGRPALPGAPSKRFSTIQSKVGSLDAISYKPKASEKKIQSFKQDFSHIKSKVDAKLVVQPKEGGEDGATPALPGSPSLAAASGGRRPMVITTTTTAGKSHSRTGSTTAARQPLSPPPSRTSSTVRTVSSTPTVSTTAAISISTATSSRSPLHSRRSSSVNLSVATSPPLSPSSPNSGSASARRLSKHIIPTQKQSFDHVKSKVGSLDNIAYKAASNGTRGRPDSRASSNGGTFSPGEGHSRSPSGARSTTSSNGTSTTTSTTQRRLSSGGSSSGFKIPTSKKVDYSKVKSKVGSLEFINHTPQGGNLRVFSEKLSFREGAQSKIAKEINITSFYQNGNQSFDTSIPEEEVGQLADPNSEFSQEVQLQEESIIYGSDAGADDFEPPMNILAVLEEVTASVGDLGLEQEQHA
ncbi:hypothetical protein BGZ83_006557 [Gryganskiella cystojenkinii]|nr:hypothetical protein BGZ83_006557 [Gryganskiella cystojenkinii]